MSESKKYYWLKLKSDFFDDDTIKFIEEQENGIKYSNFYLKLCLKSLKTDGKLIRLVGETLIPYDTVPEGRTKPWGTGQAILAARNVINEPFAVINADDYYGKEGYKILHDDLVSKASLNQADGKIQISMVAFILGNTLSDNGGVTRGICLRDAKGHLTGIRETKNIIRADGGAATMTDEGLTPVDMTSLVSMNMWGFMPSIMDVLQEGFVKFMKELPDGKNGSEYLLPTIVDGLIANDKAVVNVLSSADQWFGVTYQEDRQSVKDEFSKLVAKGVYTSPLKF